MNKINIPVKKIVDLCSDEEIVKIALMFMELHRELGDIEFAMKSCQMLEHLDCEEGE